MDAKEQAVYQEIQNLREEVKTHEELYERNIPIITDTEYDRLFMKLVDLELANPEWMSDDSPTQKIIHVVVDGLEKVAHPSPMLSQEKVITEEGLLKFCDRSTDDVLVELKLDGLTIVLTYNHGLLETAVTRGDGYVGENVTHTVRTFSNVPKQIDFHKKLQIRMEAVVPFVEFERINVNGEYSNPRNLASGTVRQLDASIAKERNLKGIVFDLVSAEGLEFSNDIEQLQFLESLGFEVVPYRIFTNSALMRKELLDFCMTYNDQHRKNLPYMIDGLVLKFVNLNTRIDLGSTSKYPKWACAYKFKSQDATTTLREVVFQVGKSGQITPVGEFDPIEIDGVNISRATLHNFRNIGMKDIRIGDRILVARAKDVIPQIVQSMKQVRTGNEQLIEAPPYCPACGAKTEYYGENLYCTGLTCQPQLQGKIEHFVSRKTLNIDGLGDKTVQWLLDEGFIHSFTDLFHLDSQEEALIAYDGFGKKKFENMMSGLEQAKNSPLHKVLYALSIPNIGESASKDISKVFSDMEEILTLATDETKFLEKLLQLNDFGPVMARSMIDFFSNEKNIQAIKDLQAVGFSMKSENQVVASSTLAGKTFVITGKLSKGRDEFKTLIESMGGKVSGSVSKKTTYLLLGEGEEGSTKHTTAIDLSIPIINETDFWSLIS